MDAIGVISLVYDVSKDLYTYYVAVKECDTDIKELRTQLLSLQRTSITVTNALKREGLRTEDKSHVEEAVSQCEEATTELRAALNKIRLDGAQPQKALEKLKAWGRKAVYPFKKSTIAGLAEEVETCQDALHMAISILQLNIGSTSVELLRELDTKLEAGTAKLEIAFRDLEDSNNVAKDEIIEQLVQQRKLLTEEKQEKKAMAIVESLRYSEMFDRMYAVAEADETSLGWLFTQESHKYSELTDLMTFLNQENGLFWIQGKPASGKSTFLKYLLNRSHGRDKLWSWKGNREVVFASHFCWIAGSPMQKSQQGLLRTLLHQILSSDFALVPIACPFQWNTGGSHGSWYEKELWDCLYAVVAASDKRICFFIDGLDEIEPEKDHAALSKAIVRLSMYENVKVVTSSRPWPSFERILRHDQRWMTMENINNRSIIKYVRSELDANSTCGTFAHVDWNCITSPNWGLCKAGHQHNDAHILVETIVKKADGVFLWVALVMDAVCRHLALGCPVQVLRSYVDIVPNKLEEYLQTMIIKRIHESLISETAMALNIFLLRPAIPFSYFTLLCQYTDSGVSWLTNADFCSALPHSTCTLDELGIIIWKTARLLRGCCRDILDLDLALIPTDMNGQLVPENVYHSKAIRFTHRTIFDFLRTSEMQALLERHVPKHFMNDSFEDELRIASCKIAVVDHDGPFTPQYDLELSKSLTRYYGDKSWRLATIVNEVALHQLEASPGSTRKYMNAITRLSIQLSAYGLFSFADAALRLVPQYIANPMQASSAMNKHGILFGHDRNSGLAILRRMLQAGLDSNFDLGTKTEFNRGDTMWRIFVRHLRLDTPADSVNETGPHRQSSAQRDRDQADHDHHAEREDLFSDPYVQEAVKLFIEFGASLTSEDIEMLKSRMPKTMADGREWSEFLLTYTRSEKRRKLQGDRKNRLKHWNTAWYQDYLSESDKELLGMKTRAMEDAEYMLQKNGLAYS